MGSHRFARSQRTSLGLAAIPARPSPKSGNTIASATIYAAGRLMFVSARGQPVAERIHTNAPRDEMIGRLLERTEQMSTQLEESRQMTGAINRTLSSLQQTIEKLNNTVENLHGDSEEHAKTLVDYNATKARLVLCESEIEKWAKLRSKAIQYAVWVALLALTSGTFGGTLLRNALNIH